MGKNKYIYIVVIGLILAILIFAFYKSLTIKKVSLNNINDVLGEKTYSLFYVGDITKEEKKKLKELREKNDLKLYELTDSRDDVVTYIKSVENVEIIEGNIYLLFDTKNYLGYIDNTKNVDEYVKKYLYGYIPVNERMYSTITVSQYSQLYNSKDKTIAVFGDDSCSYCERLESVINSIAINKEYDINYFNQSRMTQEEYDELLNMNIKIPASCNAMDKEQTMAEGYAKPMTIVTKKGKVIGCIKGYYDYNTYIAKLKDIMEG